MKTYFAHKRAKPGAACYICGKSFETGEKAYVLEVHDKSGRTSDTLFFCCNCYDRVRGKSAGTELAGLPEEIRRQDLAKVLPSSGKIITIGTNALRTARTVVAFAPAPEETEILAVTYKEEEWENDPLDDLLEEWDLKDIKFLSDGVFGLFELLSHTENHGQFEAVVIDIDAVPTGETWRLNEAWAICKLVQKLLTPDGQVIFLAQQKG